jgi:uncharacterized protein YcfJ
MLSSLDKVIDVFFQTGGLPIRIDKVITTEITRFIEDNPNLATGVTIGAAIGALIGLVPFLGVILAPLVSAVAALLGGLAGARLDRAQATGQGWVGVVQEVIIVSRKLFGLVASIFRALKDKRKDQ